MAPMDKVPTDARQLRSRRQLLDAMLHLLENRSYDQVTIREVARQAGVGYATFFRHYPSKDALLHALAAGQIADFLDRALPVLFAVSATMEILAWWLQQEPDYPLDRMAEILDRPAMAPN